MQNYHMMSPVVGETAVSGYPTYAVLPAGCRAVTPNGSLVALSRAPLSTGTLTVVSQAGPGVGSTVCGYTPLNTLQTGATLGKALASVRLIRPSLCTSAPIIDVTHVF